MGSGRPCARTSCTTGRQPRPGLSLNEPGIWAVPQLWVLLPLQIWRPWVGRLIKVISFPFLQCIPQMNHLAVYVKIEGWYRVEFL